MRHSTLEGLLVWYARRFPIRRGKMRVINSLWRAAVGDQSTQRVAALNHARFKMSCDLSEMLQRQFYFFGTYFLAEDHLRCWTAAAKGSKVVFDVGANAVKTFILVYDLPNTAALYKRFPGVEGSLYFVGGFGVNYVQRDGIALAPVRFGVGWRQGIALSYMNFSSEKRYNPL